jgi:hypothetical protein
MAIIVNYRDKLLQTAEKRTITVADPSAVVIPGYTGITLARSIDMFNGFSGGAKYVISPDRMVLTAQLKGIPINTPVTWKLGSVTGPDYLHLTFYETGTNIILTNTGDPLVKTIEASSYPIIPGVSPYSQFPGGYVQVSVNYGGVEFSAYTQILVFTG